MVTRSNIEHKNVGAFLAFNKQFFEKHQRRLLWLLNNPLTKKWFRWVLRIRKHDIGYSREIVLLLPNSYHVKGNKEGELIADFRTHPKYGKRIYYAFRPLWWVIHFWDWIWADRFIPEWSFGFSTLTAYPDPDPETTSTDGRIERVAAGGESWGTIRSGAGTEASATNTEDYYVRITSHTSSNNWTRILRSIFLFDTSALGSGATISAAIMSVYGIEKNDNLAITPNIDVYTSTPASNTNVVTGDYSNLDATSQTGSPISYASFTDAGYNDFTFDSTGRGNISLTGVSKFGLKNANYDAANSAPTWSSNKSSYLYGYYADQTGTANDPKLVITYTPGSTDVTVNPSVQSAVFSSQSTTISASHVISPNVQTAAFSLQTVTFSNDTNVLISPTVQSVISSIQSLTVKGDAQVLPNTQSSTFSIPAFTVIANAILSIATQLLTFSFLVPTRIGAFYNNKYTSRSTSYSDKYSARNTSYSDKYSPLNL